MNITASSVWSKCLKFIKDNIQPQAYKTWFEPIKAVKLADDVLSVEVPSKFFYEWLEEHYVKILQVALQKTLGDNAKLVYVIKMQNTYGNNQPFTEKNYQKVKNRLIEYLDKKSLYGRKAHACADEKYKLNVSSKLTDSFDIVPSGLELLK